MRLFIALGLLWLVAGESVQEIARDQWSTTPTIGNAAGSAGLNEQETEISKKQDDLKDQQKVQNSNQNKDVLGTEGPKKTAASDEIIYGSYTTHTDKNGIPVTIELSSNLEPGFNGNSNSNFKHPSNGGELTLDLNVNESKNKSDDRTALANDDNIHELSASLEEAKIIHEEGSEEIDSTGVIHGKYTYTLERDGIPTTIEYEASPEIGFNVKHFYKQTVDKEEENSKLTANNPLDPTNPKTVHDLVTPNYKIAAFETNIPNYEHSTVLAKYKPRFRRSDDSRIPDSTIKSPSPPGEGLVDPLLIPFNREVTAEISKGKNPYELESDQPSDASYMFGFSVDSQSRKEESDAKGNVIGSYSYVDYDGLMTKVEYEARANTGFVVKRISHEQLEPLVQKESKHNNKISISSVVEQNPEAYDTNEKEAEQQLEPLVQKESKHNNKISISSVVEQNSEAYDTNEKEAEQSSDKVISNGTPFDVREITDSINSENQGSDLEHDYSAQDKAFSIYGLPTEYHSTPPVDIEIRRAIAISEKNNQQNNIRNRIFRKVIRRPKKPNNNGSFISVMPDGSYAFSYQTDDHSRRESVDSLGNVHSSYKTKSTKRDGTTLVVFERQGINNAAINKQTNVTKKFNNILSRPKSEEAPVHDDDYNNQPHNPTGIPNIHRNKRIYKYDNGVADYIMRNTRV